MLGSRFKCCRILCHLCAHHIYVYKNHCIKSVHLIYKRNIQENYCLVVPH